MYYTSNVEFPVAVITVLSVAVVSIEPGLVDGRLSVTLTLLLTAVAYKLIISDLVPNVAYLTLLDKYVLGCFLFLALLTVEVTFVGWIDALRDYDDAFLTALAVTFVGGQLFWILLRCHASVNGNWSMDPESFKEVRAHESDIRESTPPQPLIGMWLYFFLKTHLPPSWIPAPPSKAKPFRRASALGAPSHRPKPKRIIIAGAPASGKGTQCDHIVQKFNVVHLSTGDMLREAVESFTELGTKAKEVMDRGGLVDDSIMCPLVLERLAQPDCIERGWLLDGFPRTAAQAKALKGGGHEPDLFLYLSVPDDAVLERITGRLLDPDTKKSYHAVTNPPPSEVRHRCIQRTDDTVEKVKERLSNFHDNTDAVMGLFQSVLCKVDGDRDIPAVTADVLAAVSLSQAATIGTTI